MQPATSPAPTATPTPRKSRKVWYILGGFALLLVATPVCFYFVSGWWTNRQLEEIYAEIDAEDPNWRWPDLLAEMKPPPEDENLGRANRQEFTPSWLQKTPFTIRPEMAQRRQAAGRLSATPGSRGNRRTFYERRSTSSIRRFLTRRGN